MRTISLPRGPGVALDRHATPSLFHPSTSLMSFLADTERVLNHLEQSSGGGLRKRNDLGLLLERAADMDAADTINGLAFHGKHFFGLYVALRRQTPSSEGYGVLEREFAQGAERLRELISGLMIDATTEQIERFDGLYYQMTQGSLRNLVDLAHDLGVLKSVQNDRKRA